jgi:pimeloyl-ACP methyl ester carboxylesterase
MPRPDDIRPFPIDVPEAELTDLRDRLSRTRWPDSLEASGWELGTNREVLRELCDHWANDYDWRPTEARLNGYGSSMIDVQGEQMHFLHVRSSHPDAQPIVITHGWCGSVIEHLDLLDRLVDPPAFGGDAADAFHVVVPSMPGYGFSGPTRQRGFHVHRVADAVADLMEALGYERYIAQGGDWGALVTRRLGEAYADRLTAVHFNMLFAMPTPEEQAEPDLLEGVTEAELQRLGADAERMSGETAYMDIQGTKPQSLSYGQTDSPAGLAGWVLEKFHAWVDHDGDLYSVLSRDQLIDNMMTYWLPNTVNSAARLYYESMQAGTHAISPWDGRVEVPTGHADFPGELMGAPRAWADRKYNIVHWTTQDRGGHFAAFEQPDAFARDLWAFGRLFR